MNNLIIKNMCNNHISKYQRYRQRNSKTYKDKNRQRMRKKRQKLRDEKRDPNFSS